MYTIHALQMRKLKGYKITSKEFAAAFREKFTAFANQWPNVSMQYGPLTLMEGWVKSAEDHVVTDTIALANLFFPIVVLIDNCLAMFKEGNRVQNAV